MNKELLDNEEHKNTNTKRKPKMRVEAERSTEKLSSWGLRYES